MLCDTLLSLVNKLSHTKSVCRHSKPWFTKELAEQLRLQKDTMRAWKKRSPRNFAEYQKCLPTTERLSREAKQQWIQRELMRLERVTQQEDN